MAFYCELADIYGVMSEAEVIGYTDDGDTGAVDMTRVDKARGKADARIDLYCGKKYPVPFTSPAPAAIISLAADMSAYEIASRRGAAPDEYRDKYNDAIKVLKDISTGLAVLPGVEVKASVTGSARVRMSASPRIFTRHSMRGV